MGYRSDIALKVTRHDTVHGVPLSQLWQQYVTEKGHPVSDWVAARITVTDDTWTFHAEDVKWSTVRQFTDVDYIEDWRERMHLLTETHPRIFTYSWVFVGENTDDIVADYLGDHNDYALRPLTTIVGL